VSATPKEDCKKKEEEEPEEEVPKKSPVKEVKRLSNEQLSTIKIVTEQILYQYIKYVCTFFCVINQNLCRNFTGGAREETPRLV